MNSRRLTLVPIFLALLLAGCASGDWPPLGAVERPPAPVVPAAGGAAAAKPTPVPVVDRAQLAALRARFDDLRATLQASLGVYEAALDRHLAQSPATPLFAETWSETQSSLSRLGAKIDDLRALNDAVTSFAAPMIAATADSAALLNVGELVAAVDTAHGVWRQRLYGEQNRLAVLTPATVGTPGPSAIAGRGRTAFAEIRFVTPAPGFEAKLAAALKALKAQVPDVACDVIASGPAAAIGDEQAALRRVLRTLKAAGIDYGHSAVALMPAGDTVKVEIYLKKTSL